MHYTFISSSQLLLTSAGVTIEQLTGNTEDDRQRNTVRDTRGNTIVELAQRFCHSSVGQSLYAHTVCNARVCMCAL